MIYHDRCFDGAASAGLLSRFLQDYDYGGGEVFMFHGVLHTLNFQWIRTLRRRGEHYPGEIVNELTPMGELSIELRLNGLPIKS